MLDVHPPHHATHAWKDFFLHVATITVGLLIAPGLEQVVGAAHHRIQRTGPVASLMKEIASNLGATNLDLPDLAAHRRIGSAGRLYDKNFSAATHQQAHDLVGQYSTMQTHLSDRKE